MYQLASQELIPFTVVHTFHQTQGIGYTGNEWQSHENQNLTFSFLLVDALSLQKDLPVLNMWIALSIVQVLSNWQVEAQIKWPNDIIIQGKKAGGILIQTKINNNQIKFVVVGIGLNVYQADFNHLPSATSIVSAYPNFDKPLHDCLMELLYHLEKSYESFMPSNYLDIISSYHQHLFKLDQVASYEIDGKQHNGILRQIDQDGNAIIEIEDIGRKTFRHKEVKLNY